MAVASLPAVHPCGKMWNLLRAARAARMGAAVLLVAAGAGEHAAARQAKQMVAATVVETAEYIPCGSNRCSAGGDPARAFCLRAGEETLVGDGRSLLHAGKLSGMEDYGGKQVQIRWNRRWIWMTAPDGTHVKLERGSQYEDFKDAGCVAAVNEPVLERARHVKRPGRVPAGAVAIAGPEHGDNPQRFLWYACAADAGDAIRCRRWYRDGDAYGDEWYCAKTLDGKAVGAEFTLNALESDAGHLVLSGGGVLEPDRRARVDGKLERPGAACY